jgi:hypothetical protein
VQFLRGEWEEERLQDELILKDLCEFGVISALAKGTVDLELFGGQLGENGLVAATVGFGDKSADLALAAF